MLRSFRFRLGHLRPFGNDEHRDNVAGDAGHESGENGRHEIDEADEHGVHIEVFSYPAANALEDLIAPAPIESLGHGWSIANRTLFITEPGFCRIDSENKADDKEPECIGSKEIGPVCPGS